MRAAVVGISGKVGGELARLNRADFQVVCGFDESKPLTDCKTPDFDVIIEFAAPEATEKTLDFALEHGIPVVIGTTGHSELQLEKIEKAAKRIAVALAPNYSVGAFALKKAAVLLAETLPKCEKTLIETHRTGKRDAPGGTAKQLSAAVGGAVTVSVRRGDQAGIHELIFDMENESVTLVHRAESRRVFALGAVKAAEKLVCFAPGLYGAEDFF